MRKEPLHGGSFEATVLSETENQIWQLFSTHFQPSRQAIACFLEHLKIRPAEKERGQVYADASEIAQDSNLKIKTQLEKPPQTLWLGVLLEPALLAGSPARKRHSGKRPDRGSQPPASESGRTEDQSSPGSLLNADCAACDSYSA